MNRVIIQGFKRELDAASLTSTGKLQLKESYQFSSTRGASDKHTLDIDKDDFLELVFEDATTWVGGADVIHDIFPNAAKKNRAVGGDFEIPMYLETDESTRGVIGNIALKVLNVFTKKAVTEKVIDIAAGLEKKMLQNMSGVYRVNKNFELGKATFTKAAETFLLFIHGTNSSTAGSFAEIKDSDLWKKMQATYGENIIGLQHETLTKSPVENVIALFKQLPAKCTLHVITHSRGGLVGDVLARFCNGNKGFSTEEIEYLNKTERKADLANIKILQTAAAGKNINIEKYIRVACPAYGTTILSKRLDHFLNISLNLIGLMFGPAGKVITGEIKSLIAAAVETKNDPNDLPGLEAMNPDSPFLKILNNPANEIAGPLTVISGNCGMRFNLKALLVIASKLFYMRDNDLVVDTKSMYCGTKRKTGLQFFFDEGPEVDHVHYFFNKKTQAALQLALQIGIDKIPGFTPIAPAATGKELEKTRMFGLEGGEVFSSKVSGDKPILILLPGIMGSNLQFKDDRIWINYIRFLTGGLTKLSINKPDIKASSLIKTSYKKLADYLKKEYDVVTFAFDWRLPLADAAALLKDSIEKYLKLKQPIKIVGHSMGGVVTRDFIINHPATWKKLNASKGFKLLFLGTPLGGSYRIPYVLAGKDPIINQLSKIDLVHTKKELLDMFRKYPGLLGLLPLAKEPDFAKLETWQKMKNASLFDWNIPDDSDLQFFGKYRDKVLSQMETIEMDNVIYIAGKDDATVCGFEIDDNLPGEKIIFKSTKEGDQSVTWDTGIPKNINPDTGLYFAEVSHGALANDTGMFKGISEILSTGKTELLSKVRPANRGKAAEFIAIEEENYDTDESSVEEVLLGLKPKPRIESKSNMPVKVSVSNGDLLYSSYPVLVGHFLTDGITSAEAVIDYHTGHVLREWHRLGLYPGEIGTSEVFINFNNEFKGTVVIGLGAPGRLSAFQLAKTTEQGAIKYMLETKRMRQNTKETGPRVGSGISVLLIGCGYGGLTIDSSIRAILQGIQKANNSIEEMAQVGISTIDHVEFVELYEDRCLQCLFVLSKMEAEADSNIRIQMPRKQYKKLLGWQVRIPMETESSWWSRINIVLHKEENKETKLTERALRFSCSTGSAREEQRDLLSSPDIINKLVDDMSTQNRWNKGIAKTVFELLIPNDFKDELKKQANTLWVLDNAAAAYPWELLQDNTGNADPICCSTGMIRQLQTENYRIKINASTGNKALVVGDPNLNGFKYAQQLKGAYKEAEEVENLLGYKGFDMPNNCIFKSSTEIVQAIFKDEYRIIHLAGHGVFNEKEPQSSGMLIGNGVFLTTREICQISKVPDLVFVNCCYLGNINESAEETYNNRYKLAANIGTQLIMNGVKVVIAAGWAVEDEAALHFTKVFYDGILNDMEFGKAVKNARKSTYDNFSKGGNTWGAYQCYGDPFFKLTNITRSAGSRPGFVNVTNLSDENKKSAEPVKPKYTFLIAQEAEVKLINLINKADTKGYTLNYLEEELQRIVGAVKAAGLNNASVIEREAIAYTELNDYEKAVEKFETLLGMEYAGFTVKALEKYCNVRAKLAVKKWQDEPKTKKNTTSRLNEIKKVIEDLTRLNTMSATAERNSLLGSAYKRRAMILTAKSTPVNELVTAANYYREASAMPGNTNKTYSLTNLLEIENILVLAGKHKWASGSKKGKMPSLKAAKDSMDLIIDSQSKSDADMDYWTEVSIANATLCRWLLEGKNTKDLSADKVYATYHKIWSRAGSQHKKAAEIEHFDFLIDVYKNMIKKSNIAKIIERIKKDLVRIIN